MHDFKSDFYGYDMQAVVLGYIAQSWTTHLKVRHLRFWPEPCC